VALVTSVWGSVLFGELMVRIILIYSVSSATVLIVSPILIGTLTIATMIWTFRYGHRMRLRTMARLNPVHGNSDPVIQSQ
jgi:hypothetical protein